MRRHRPPRRLVLRGAELVVALFGRSGSGCEVSACDDLVLVSRAIRGWRTGYKGKGETYLLLLKGSSGHYLQRHDYVLLSNCGQHPSRKGGESWTSAQLTREKEKNADGAERRARTSVAQHPQTSANLREEDGEVHK